MNQAIQKYFLCIFIILPFLTNCRIFKESALDPNSELSTLLNLMRLAALADSFNGRSNTLAIVKFSNSFGASLSGGEVVYSVFNENDENNVPVTEFGDSGNFAPYKSSLDANGRTILKFQERGFAEVAAYTNIGDPTPLGTFRFRNYKGLTKETFTIHSQTGNFIVSVEDVANYPNPLGSAINITPLGTANERSFLMAKAYYSNDGGATSYYEDFILSSSDGVTYDKTIPISNITDNTTSSGYTTITPSAVAFDGTDYVIFLNEAEFDITNVPIKNRNLALKIPQSATSFIPISPIEFTLPTNIQIVTPISASLVPSEHPMFSLGGRFFVVADNASLAPNRTVPYLVSLNGESHINLSDPPYNCLRSDISNFSAYGKRVNGGIEYLHCPTSLIPSTSINATVVRANDLNVSTLVFNASAATVNSFPFVFANELVGLALYLGNPTGYTFPTGSYLINNATISANPIIAGFTVTYGSTNPMLRNITTSKDVGYSIIANDPNLGTATNKSIFRFTNQLNSASEFAIPTISPTFNENTGSHRQFQSTQGKLIYFWQASQVLSSPASIGSFKFYATRSTEFGSWSDPKLIRIQ